MEDVTLFIDSEYLRKISGIEENVDDSKLYPSIFNTQYNDLLEILGNHFFNYLVEKYTLNVLSIDEQSLISNFIQPLHAYLAWHDSLFFLLNKSTNKSVSNENSQFSQSVDVRNIEMAEARVSKYINTSRTALIRELKLNCYTKYPEAKPKFGEAKSANHRQDNSVIYFPKN